MKNKAFLSCLPLLFAFLCLPFAGNTTIVPLNCTTDTIGNIGIQGERDTFSMNIVAGERFIVRMAETSGSGLYPNIELYAPDGTKLAEHEGSTLARLDVTGAPQTGTYLLVAMDGFGTGTGGYGLSLQILKPSCTQNTITCTGELSNESLNSVAAMKAYQFTASAGERIIVRMADAPGSGLYPNIELYAPNGTKLAEHEGSTLARLDVANAPEAGTYILVAMDGFGTGTGGYGLSLQILSTACTQNTIACTGELSNESLNSVAAMNAYQFTASAGERIIVRMAETPGSGLYPNIELYAPNGSKLAEHEGSTLARLDVTNAPETGTYILVAMDGFGTGIGGYGLSLQILEPACTQNTIACTGELSNESLNSVAAMNAYQFTASVGEQIIVRMADAPGSGLYPNIELYAPNGSKLAEHEGSTLARLDVANAPETGTYILVAMDGFGTGIGGYGLSLQILSASCTQNTIACTGDLSNESLNSVAAMNAYQFNASVGEQIIVRMAETPGSGLYPNIELYAPNGSKLAEHEGSTLARLDVAGAPQTGTYILVAMDGFGTGTGGYGLSLQILKSACTQNPIACTGDLNNESLNSVAAMNAYQFTASAGERIIVRMADAPGSSLYPNIELYAPNGSKLAEHEGSTLARLDVAGAPQTGTYILVAMDGFGTGTGGYGLSLQVLDEACAAVIPECPYSTNTSLSAPGEMDAFIFTASSGNDIVITMSDQGSNVYPVIQVFDPTGLLIGDVSNSTTATATLQNLTINGNYFIVVYDYFGTGIGNYTLSVDGCTDDPDLLCVAPPVVWQNAPASVCAGSSITLSLANTDANFDFQLYQNGTLTGAPVSGSGGNLSFGQVTILENSTFTATATLKTDPACIFDLSPSIKVDVGGLTINYDAKDETAFNNDGSIIFCIAGGAAPFTLEHEPQSGILTEIPKPDSCVASYEWMALRAGYYQLTVRDASGCSQTQVVKVDNPEKRRIGFPEKPLLTPNGDGKNDELAFDGLLFFTDDSELTVFNRYGSVVYQSKPYLNNWDAKYDGNPVPADTYFYTLRLFGQEGEVLYTGFVTVVY